MKKIQTLRPAIAAFLLMMAMSLTTTGMSFFVSPVCDELSLGRGSFTIYYSMMLAAGAFSATFLGQYISRKGVKPIVFLAGIWSGAGLFLFSFASQLWMFYVIAAVMGLLATSCMSLCANVIVQQSYSSEQASGFLGVVMAGSGVGGMVFSMMIPGVIENYGWRMGYRFLSFCWVILVLSAFLILGNSNLSTAKKVQNASDEGMTRGEALHSYKLYFLMAAICIFTATGGIQQQLPSLLSGMDFATAQVGVMMSMMTGAMAVGKILQGLLYGKVGIKKGSYIIVSIYAAGYLLLLNRGLVYPALIALAIGGGVITTLMPMVARTVFGSKEYAAIWSILATASSVGSFAATPVWGVVYDGTGSYTPALFTATALLIAALAAIVSSLPKSNTQR